MSEPETVCAACYNLGTVGAPCLLCGRRSTRRVTKFEEDLASEERRRAAKEEADVGRRTHWTAVAPDGRAGGVRFRCATCGTVARTKTAVQRRFHGAVVTQTLTGIPPDECPHCYLPTAEARQHAARPRVRRHLARR